jgi:hypothetical protein
MTGATDITNLSDSELDALLFAHETTAERIERVLEESRALRMSYHASNPRATAMLGKARR